jgi:uncharacterized membrane protein YkvA (DUF1232 family)
MQDPITFEESKRKAAEYVASEKKATELLARVRAKAKRNYQALLGAWESLHILLRMVRDHTTGRCSAPLGTILAAITAMIYLVEPFDLIPDPVPVFGRLDDLRVITFVVRSNRSEISKFREWECS